MIFRLYEIGACCDQAWLSDNLWVESRTFVSVIYSVICSLPATTYLVCPTQNCVVFACECVSGPKCSCARNSFISRKVAPVFKFCTINLYRVNGDEKFHAVFCFCGLPVHCENKNILHQLEYTSSNFYCKWWCFPHVSCRQCISVLVSTVIALMKFNNCPTRCDCLQFIIFL